MKLKRFLLIVLFAGVLLAMLGGLMPVHYLNAAQNNPSTSIIGGADAPTYWLFAASLFGGLPYVLMLLGVSLIISAAVYLLIVKTIKKHCDLRSTAIALGLSGIGALGLVCFFEWLAIVAFQNMEQYPIQYPVSILLGILSLCAFLALLFLYFKVRKEKWSWIGIIIDVLTAVIYFPSFFLLLCYLENLIA